MPPSRTNPRPPRPRRSSAAGAARLFGIARALSSNLYLDGLLAQIVHATEHLAGAEASSLLLWDEEARSLFFHTATGAKGDTLEKRRVPLGQGVAGWVMEHDRSVIVKDARRDPRFSGYMDKSTGFTTRSLLAVPLRIGGRVAGVCEALNKKRGGFTARDQKTLEEMAALAGVCVENARRAESQANFFDHMMDILTAAIEATRPHYLGHPFRVAETAVALGRRLGLAGEALESLRHGALLHDVGMIAVNHRTLAEQAAVRAAERTADLLHPVLGADLLSGVKRFKTVTPIVRHHHERWDGLGHPDGLAGDAIPLGARVVGLVEDLEELRFSALPDADLKPLMAQRAKNGSGTLFDPRVVEAYLSLDAAPAAPPAR